MRYRWITFWIFVLLIGVGFLVWQFVFRGAAPAEPPGQEQTGTELPEGEKVNLSGEELNRWVEAFKSGKELWRSNAVEVVKRERERLGIPSEADVREHGEYVRRPDGTRRTLIFALTSGLEIGQQKTVLMEERPAGIWVPIEVGPFFLLVDKTSE